MGVKKKERLKMNENEKKYVEKTLKKYEEPKSKSKLDELRTLDKKAKRNANIFAYVFGIIGALVLGFGMCIAMEIILTDLMWLGIIIGVIGIFMVCINYFIYQSILNKDKEKYAPKIKAISQELLKNE